MGVVMGMAVSRVGVSGMVRVRAIGERDPGKNGGERQGDGKEQVQGRETAHHARDNSRLVLNITIRPHEPRPVRPHVGNRPLSNEQAQEA